MTLSCKKVALPQRHLPRTIHSVPMNQLHKLGSSKDSDININIDINMNNIIGRSD